MPIKYDHSPINPCLQNNSTYKNKIKSPKKILSKTKTHVKFNFNSNLELEKKSYPYSIVHVVFIISSQYLRGFLELVIAFCTIKIIPLIKTLQNITYYT